MEKVKLTVAKKFRYECSQTQLTFVILNTVTGRSTFRAIFDLREMEKVRVT